MASWLDPVNTTPHANVLDMLHTGITAAATMSAGGLTNLPVGFLNLNYTNKYVEKWDGAAWGAISWLGESPTLNALTVTTVNGGVPWTSANDGHLSGLDADLWDGYQFANYLNQAVRTSDSPLFNALTVGGYANKGYIYSDADGWVTIRHGLSPAYHYLKLSPTGLLYDNVPVLLQGAYGLGGAEMPNISSQNLNNNALAEYTGWMMGQNVTNAPSANWFLFQTIRHNLHWAVQLAYDFAGGSGVIPYIRRIVDGGGYETYGSWFTSYHSGTDGSGSGLDADVLRGYAPGNLSNNIPISNGLVSFGLNAERWNSFKLYVQAPINVTNLANNEIRLIFSYASSLTTRIELAMAFTTTLGQKVYLGNWPGVGTGVYVMTEQSSNGVYTHSIYADNKSGALIGNLYVYFYIVQAI